jgi:uncharacterized protein (TIGR00303 family)
MRFVLAAGSTETAAIDGLSAAGADPELRCHTPSADAEILAFGRPVRSSVVPVSPTGCPTPAVVTRAARELVGFPVTVIDAGLAKSSAAELTDVGATRGTDIREPIAVPTVRRIAERAREMARSAPEDERVYLAETIPGGTTTAMAVLVALGEPAAVSSSLATNPIERKRDVVEAGLAASGLSRGGAAGEPYRAIEAVGDPVLAALAGYARGAIETETPLTLAGGTQLLTVAACLRQLGIDAELDLATTTFVRADSSADVAGLAARFDVDLTATDPGFDALEHPATRAYLRGEAKEGVGMGGALSVVADSSRSMAALRERTVGLTDELLAASRAGDRS